MLNSKVNSNPYICKIIFYFKGRVMHEISNLNAGLEQFYSSRIINQEFEDIYFGKGSFSFSESSSQTDEGVIYQQNLSFAFPSNDQFRAERIDKLHQVQLVELQLNNGMHMLIGRNDYTNNAKIPVTSRSNLQKSSIEISNQSDKPASFVEIGNRSSAFYGSNFGEAVYS